MRTVFLENDKIYLSSLTPKLDLKGYASWLNDGETTLFMGSGRFPVAAKELKAYIESYEKSRTGMLLGIFLKNSHKHIGNITLHMIDWKDRHGEIGILIGDKAARGQGFATQAIRLVAEHAFDKLNLHKLCAGMVDDNKGSRRIFEKIGFKLEGTLRQHFYLNNKYRDCYRLGLLKAEYKKS